MPVKKVNKQTKSLKKNDDRIKKICSRIKQLRIDAGYTSLEKFAYEFDINRTQYARYERGEDMRISSLLKVLDAHGVTLEEFFRGVLESP